MNIIIPFPSILFVTYLVDQRIVLFNNALFLVTALPLRTTSEKAKPNYLIADKTKRQAPQLKLPNREGDFENGTPTTEEVVGRTACTIAGLSIANAVKQSNGAPATL